MVGMTPFSPSTSAVVMTTVSPGRQSHDIVAHHAGANLRPLQVAENGDRPAAVAGKFADRGDRFRQFRMPAVGEVEPEDIGAGLHQGQEHLPRGAGRTDGGDDFVATKIRGRQSGLLYLLETRLMTSRRLKIPLCSC